MEDRIQQYKAFLRKWRTGLLIAFGVLSILCMLGWASYLNGWLQQISKALPLSILILIKNWWEAQQLSGKGGTTFTEALKKYRKQQSVQQYLMVGLLAIGICLAVMAAVWELREEILFLSLATVIPLSPLYLGVLGLGLQTDWLLHSLSRNT